MINSLIHFQASKFKLMYFNDDGKKIFESSTNDCERNHFVINVMARFHGPRKYDPAVMFAMPVMQSAAPDRKEVNVAQSGAEVSSKEEV